MIGWVTEGLKISKKFRTGTVVEGTLRNRTKDIDNSWEMIHDGVTDNNVNK